MTFRLHMLHYQATSDLRDGAGLTQHGQTPSLMFVRNVGCSIISSEPLIPLIRMLLRRSMHRRSTIDIASILCMHLRGRHRNPSKHVRTA
jgi:hypothetical protein